MPSTINTRNRYIRSLLWLLFFVYSVVLLKLIIFKRSPGFIKQHFLHHYSWRLVKANMHTANLRPFTTIRLYLNSHGPAEYAVNNLLGNIAGFIPLGILLPLLFIGLRRAWSTVFCVFLFSLAFETVQLVSMLGVFDVDDLLLNTLGGSVGFLFFLLLKKIFIIK